MAFPFPPRGVSDTVQLTILIPIYNDWASARTLLAQLDNELAGEGVTVEVLLIDDGSRSRPMAMPDRYRVIRIVEILCLRRNLGHQRAIAIGLAYIERNGKSEYVLIMDGDGEDAPGAVPALLAKMRSSGSKSVVFAERKLRSEGVIFRAFYHLYRTIHFVLTGVRIRYGNFSVIPRTLLSQLVTFSDLWNHYAATVSKSKIPFETVPTNRAKRISGRSNMNFVGLVVHGLSALSVHGETVMVRILLASTGIFLSAFIGLFIAILGNHVGWLSWPESSFLVLFMALFTSMSLLAFSTLFCFLMLGFRSNAAFIPSRDFTHFVGETLVYEHLSEDFQHAS